MIFRYLVVLFVLLTTQLSFAAKPTKAQLAEAKASFKDATAKYDAGQFDEALKGFEHSHELSRNPILFFNMAACAEKMNQSRVAAAYLRTYLSEVPNADDADKVRERIGGLEVRAQVEDEHRVDEERRADDEARKRKEADERAAKLQQQQSQQQQPVAGVSEAPPPPPEPVGQKYKGGFIALGVTAGLGIIGAALGGDDIARYNHLKSQCGDVGCGNKVDSVHGQAIGADVMFGLTGAAAIATVVIFALEAKHHGGAR